MGRAGVPGKTPEGHLVFSGTVDGNGRSVVRGFPSTLGQHANALATSSTAEQVYTRSVLKEPRLPTASMRAARATVRTGTGVEGMLDPSRAGRVEFGAAAGVPAGVTFLPAIATAVATCCGTSGPRRSAACFARYTPTPPQKRTGHHCDEIRRARRDLVCGSS